ncbi:MAG: 50S ribosomal protein L13 [Candidatus Omnitrophota bacterium]
MIRTYMQNVKDVKRTWYLMDAKDKVLGRFAVSVAKLLHGKEKTTFTPHVDGGDYVVVINAKEIRVTGKKLHDKIYSRYSGYPSGRREMNLETLLKKRPEQVIRLAVSRMLPKNKLAKKMMRRLKVYAENKHPHQVQNIMLKKA